MKTSLNTSSPRMRGSNKLSLGGIFNWIPAFAGMTVVSILYYLFVLIHPVYAQQATLSLSPSSGTINKSCNFSVNIDLDTGGAQTDGTDAILIYDPSRLSATSILSGSIYNDYPGNNIDEVEGRITVSGLASVSTAFSGQGTLATLNFLVNEDAPTGVTQVKFDFDPNSKSNTTDSNVVQRGTVADILNSVVDGNYTIGTAACGTGTGIDTGIGPGVGAGPGGTIGGQGAVEATPSGKIPLKTLPPAGSETLTYTLTILGAVLTILGILGLALL